MGAQAGTMASKEAGKAMISVEIANDQSYAKATRKASWSELPDLEAINFNEDLSIAAAETLLTTISRGDARRALERAAGEMTGPGEAGRQSERKIVHGVPADLRGGRRLRDYLRG